MKPHSYRLGSPAAMRSQPSLSPPDDPDPRTCKHRFRPSRTGYACRLCGTPFTNKQKTDYEESFLP